MATYASKEKERARGVDGVGGTSYRFKGRNEGSDERASSEMTFRRFPLSSSSSSTRFSIEPWP